MASKKFVAFFATKNGQITTAVLTFGAITTSVLAQYLPNTFLLEQSRQFLQLYSGGFPVPVSSDILGKVEQVKKDLKISENVAEILPSAFTVFGFDILHIGSLTYRTGALLGIPKNFSYSSPIKESEKKDIVVGQKTIHWSSPDGQLLESSLILSDSAQKFAIAREIVKANSHQVSILSALNASAIAAYYYFTYHFNRKGKFFQRPLPLRVGIYSIIGSIAFTMWMFIKDFSTYNFEETADEKAASLSEEYAQGALEFYTKILQRNIALRSLLGEEGPKLFTASGNVVETFRTKHVPFVIHRDKAALRCESLKKPLEELKASHINTSYQTNVASPRE